MQINWSNIGKDYNGTDQQKADIQRAIDRLEWLPIPVKNLPFSQGKAIAIAIDELRLPNVSHLAYSHDIDKGSFLGIKCNYRAGPVYVYFLDIGTEAVVLRHDVVNETLRRRYDGETVLEDKEIEHNGVKIPVTITVYGDKDEADPDVGHNHAQWSAETFVAEDENGNRIQLTLDEEESFKDEAEQQLSEEDSDNDANHCHRLFRLRF